MLFEFVCIPWGVLSEEHAKDFGGEEEGAAANKTSFREASGSLATRIVGLFGKIATWRLLILIVVPQYLLLMVIVCLIPARIQDMGLPAVVLTYSNLLNGIAGLYLGEGLYALLQKKFSIIRIYGLMLLLDAGSIYVLHMPILVIVFVLLSAVLTGSHGVLRRHRGPHALFRHGERMYDACSLHSGHLQDLCACDDCHMRSLCCLCSDAFQKKTRGLIIHYSAEIFHLFIALRFEHVMSRKQDEALASGLSEGLYLGGHVVRTLLPARV